MSRQAPSKTELDQIIGYMDKDVRRELFWAAFWDRGNRFMRLTLGRSKAPVGNEHIAVVDGGGNYLAALGLLCYTEAFGKFRRRKRGENDEGSEVSFKEFFGLLGDEYRTLLAADAKPYGSLRSAFVHEYSPIDICVSMFGDDAPYRGPDGKWHLSVYRYYGDLMNAVKEHESELHR